MSNFNIRKEVIVSVYSKYADNTNGKFRSGTFLLRHHKQKSDQGSGRCAPKGRGLRQKKHNKIQTSSFSVGYSMMLSVGSKYNLNGRTV
jgi:hypothetical protein